jgi:hypothetical protein
VAGPAPQNASQAQRDEGRDHGEEQDVNVREALGHSGPMKPGLHQRANSSILPADAAGEN